MSRSSLVSLVAVALQITACGGSDRPPGSGREDGGPTTALDAAVDAPMGIDVGPLPDPFDPRNGCGASTIPTERVPGSILLVFDDSASMQEDPRGNRPPMGESRWQIATRAINDVLATVPDELNVGLLLFPGPANGCDVAPTPQVAVDRLGVTRAVIRTTLGRTPTGNQTPAMAAVEAGWMYMLGLAAPGQKGVVLVTDGAENCRRNEADERAIHDAARTNHLAYGVSTYAVGLTTTNNFLSGLAHHGGTPRTSTCMPMCSVDGRACTTNADCMGGSCTSLPFVGSVCVGGPTQECCHYDVSASGFRAEFEEALQEIARRFLDSCVFDLPRGADPSSFDPGQVNVGVTFAGEDRTVLRQSSNPAVDSWNYTTPDHSSIVVQGPICERLLDGDAVVEIVLGCPTLLI
ncbi:MAG: hypothetical protein KF901_09055 [Myxococcales bacterium]|nr:hypothetical protein [Myxococcales bacterium]